MNLENQPVEGLPGEQLCFKDCSAIIGDCPVKRASSDNGKQAGLVFVVDAVVIL